MKAKTAAISLIGFLILNGITSCATSVKFAKQLPRESRVSANDEVGITMVTAAGVSMLKYERERLLERVQQKIESTKMLNSSATGKRQYAVEITVTSYEKGSSVARYLAPGLGKIHIDSVVKVYLLPSREMLAEFNVKQTFAGGGIYGASTRIEDIEEDFAKGIAETLTGQKGRT
jgi:hypothetical protein